MKILRNVRMPDKLVMRKVLVNANRNCGSGVLIAGRKRAICTRNIQNINYRVRSTIFGEFLGIYSSDFEREMI